MRKNKRAQAVLPFFGLQLASVIIFLVVVISLLMMRRNLIMFVNEFNLETENILMTRRMLSTTDCFAYEERNSHFYDSGDVGYILSGRRIFPYTIDVAKLNDTKHLDCMRKDFFDNVPDVEFGLVDITLGTGSSTRYELAIFDLSANGYIYGESSVGYLVKSGSVGCAFGYECTARYGPGFSCSGSWSVPIISNLLAPFGVGTGVCVNSTGGEERMLYHIFKPIKYNLMSYGDGYNCTDRNSKRAVFPVMLKYENSFSPGLVYIKTCQVQGANYKGTPFCEKSFQAGGGEGCG